MSSKYVRETINQYLDDNSTETFIDISGEYRELLDLVTDNGVTVDDNWVGVQFSASSEEPISIQAKCYREFGIILMHVVAPVGPNVIYTNIIDRAETLMGIFRGKRIGEIVIESIKHMNTERSTRFKFDKRFTSGTFFVNYYRDLKGA